MSCDVEGKVSDSLTPCHIHSLPLTHSLSLPLTIALTLGHTHLRTHLLTSALTHSPIHLFTHTYLFIHTHSLTYSSTCHSIICRNFLRKGRNHRHSIRSMSVLCCECGVPCLLAAQSHRQCKGDTFDNHVI